MEEFKVDYFLVGVPKSASTWIYQCCRGHPQIATPGEDSLKYFDLKYHKGSEWYQQKFEGCDLSKVVIDPSPTYIRSPSAPARIARDFPHAKFIVSLRNPVDRAFSQFWHEKKNGDIPFEFEDCLEKFLLYSWYIDTGMYADLLDRWLVHFDRSRFKIVLFDDLRSAPSAFIEDIFMYMGIDAAYSPPMLNKKVNEAGGKVTAVGRKVNMLKKAPLLYKTLRSLKQTLALNDHVERALGVKGSNEAYKQGMREDVRLELQSIYAPQVKRLEAEWGLDLSSWNLG